MKKRHILLLLALWWLPLLIMGAWDNTLPSDATQWNSAAGQIRNNWDALETAFSVDLALDNWPRLLSSTTVAFNANADTTLYTVPSGKTCVLLCAVVVAGADAGTTDISIGQDGTETNFVSAITLSALDASGDAAILEPIMADPVAKIEAYSAGTVIQAKIENQAGGATNTVKLYGITY
jgi:hypothetical protein